MTEPRSMWSQRWWGLVPALILLWPEHIPPGVYPHVGGRWSIPIWCPEHRFDDLRGALSIAMDAVNEVEARGLRFDGSGPYNARAALRIRDILTASHALDYDNNPMTPSLIDVIRRKLCGEGSERVTRATVEAADSFEEYVKAATCLALELELRAAQANRELLSIETMTMLAERARRVVIAMCRVHHMVTECSIAVTSCEPTGVAFRARVDGDHGDGPLVVHHRAEFVL